MARRLKAKQLDLPVTYRWGGRREGAGRKPAGNLGGCDPDGEPRPGVSHLRREDLDPVVPLHITVRAVRTAPSLRKRKVAAAVGALLKRRARRDDLPCRVVHFTLQPDHMHLVVEADDREALARGMQGLLSGIARVSNRAAGKAGRFWRDRYHARALASPREVRNCILYVLRNGQKHGITSRAIDAFSSAAWFEGFADHPPLRADAAPVVPARHWLLEKGWCVRGGGRIRPEDWPRR